MTSALATAFPSDLLNAIPTETKKTYGVDQNGVYIWGNTYKDRKYLTEEEQKKGLAFMGPMSLEIISGSPMGNDKDYLAWHYEEPQDDETLESVQFNFPCSGNYNQEHNCKLIQFGPAYLVAQLLQLCKNGMQLQDTVGKIFPKPGNQVIFTPIWIVGSNGKFRKVPIQWESSIDRRPDYFEENIDKVCHNLGQRPIFLQQVNDSTTDYQEDD